MLTSSSSSLEALQRGSSTVEDTSRSLLHYHPVENASLSNCAHPRNRSHLEVERESTEGHTWSYVPSKNNSADLVSSDLISNSSSWWSGPTFLSKHEADWPKMPNVTVKHDLPELIACYFALNNNSNANLISNLITNKFKSTNLQNTIVYL